MTTTLRITVQPHPAGGFICTADGMTFWAPPEGGLLTDDGRVLLDPRYFAATDVASARWLVRRALEA